MPTDASSAPPLVERHPQPCFLVTCKDAQGKSHLRETHLDGHLSHVETHWRRYVAAGPIRNPGEDALVGSVFLVLADDLEDAKALMEGDPYVTCGLYAQVEYKHLTLSIGQFIGGKIWGDPDSIRSRALGGAADGASV
ncbi:MAG: YciI family protein [Pseudomonadota bacterium]